MTVKDKINYLLQELNMSKRDFATKLLAEEPKLPDLAQKHYTNYF